MTFETPAVCSDFVVENILHSIQVTQSKLLSPQCATAKEEMA